MIDEHRNIISYKLIYYAKHNQGFLKAAIYESRFINNMLDKALVSYRSINMQRITKDHMLLIISRD